MRTTRRKTSASDLPGHYWMAIVLFFGFFAFMQMRWLEKNPKHQYRPSDIFTVPCRYCHQDGLIVHPDTKDKLLRCPVCNGLGKRLVKKFNDNEVLCPVCDGMGYRVSDDLEKPSPCPRCHGIGVLSLLDRHAVGEREVVVPWYSLEEVGKQSEGKK